MRKENQKKTHGKKNHKFRKSQKKNPQIQKPEDIYKNRSTINKFRSSNSKTL